MSAGKRRVHFQNSSLLQNNPYVDSFPRGSPLSPYASSFSSPAAAAAASVGGSGGGGRHPETGAVHNRASRTTKKAQKLVLFPEAPLDRGMGSDSDLFVEQLQPLLADIRTVAEESSRDHRIDLPRGENHPSIHPSTFKQSPLLTSFFYYSVLVTAYCCGESYDLGKTHR